MGLKQAQAALARLFTDNTVRDLFRNDPEAFRRQFELNDRDVAFLQAASAAQVSQFAESLKRKRLGEARSLLPRACRLLGDRLYPLFWEFAEANPLQSRQKHQRDAIAFSSFLQTRKEVSRVVADLARFEATRLEANMRPAVLLIRHFRHRVWVDPPTPGRSWAIWVRPSPQFRLRHYFF